MSESFLNGRIVLHCGDMREVLAQLPENSIDSCVCDPPYHLTSIVKRFGSDSAAPAQHGTDGAFARSSSGFMGKKWDGGEIAFEPETWAAVYRVLKPGGHLLAFGAPKNFGFMQVAIANAGFEIRDVLAWMFGSGFPKSHDVSKGIDRAAGAEREVVEKRTKLQSYGANEIYGDGPDKGGIQQITAPATSAARQWAGWGSALKPAYEPIIMARKPLIGTIAENVLEHGTGAINIDGCRVGTGSDKADGGNSGQDKDTPLHGGGIRQSSATDYNLGRWPANVVHDGSEEVVAAFPDYVGGQSGGTFKRKGGAALNCAIDGSMPQSTPVSFADSGSAARFFYTAKADSDDRLGSKHPTVKPIDLMQWLVRLVTPKGGMVLDCFAGTGTTGEAAFREGMNALLIEREAEYQADIRRRIELVLSGPYERFRETIKEKLKGKPVDMGPLFSAAE